jgi:hypothetical protein
MLASHKPPSTSSIHAGAHLRRTSVASSSARSVSSRRSTAGLSVTSNKLNVGSTAPSLQVWMAKDQRVTKASLSTLRKDGLVPFHAYVVIGTTLVEDSHHDEDDDDDSDDEVVDDQDAAARADTGVAADDMTTVHAVYIWAGRLAPALSVRAAREKAGALVAEIEAASSTYHVVVKPVEFIEQVQTGRDSSDGGFGGLMSTHCIRIPKAQAAKPRVNLVKSVLGSSSSSSSSASKTSQSRKSSVSVSVVCCS